MKKANLLLSKRMELLGLTLVLLSSFVQFFIFNVSQGVTNDAIVYKIESKLDKIFMATTSNFQALHPENEAYFYTNPSTFKNYTYAEQNKNLEQTKEQTDWLGRIVGSLFIIGSALIIGAKIIEIQKEAQHINLSKEYQKEAQHINLSKEYQKEDTEPLVENRVN